MSDRLGAYLRRIGLDRAPAAVPEGLRMLQRAHRQAIAFENLDILLGRPIAVDADSVFDKLVTCGRGGYCFEQNRLYGEMLALLGIPNRPLLARVRLALPEGSIPPRTHVLLLADLHGDDWIADAGFGGSYVPPLPLEDGASAGTSDLASHRLRHLGLPDGEWVLERAGPRESTDGRARPDSEWQAQYTFDLAPAVQADLVQANHWTATAPSSRFTQQPVATLVLSDGFASLSNRELKLTRGTDQQVRGIEGASGLRASLHEVFGLDLSLEEAAALDRSTPAERAK